MISQQYVVAPALVLFLGDEPVSLWDPEVSGLVEELEDRLQGVFVTCATGSDGPPSIADALGAVRFAGCSSAVVVTPEASPPAGLERSFSRASMPWVEVDSAWTSGAIAAAYEQHRGRALRRQVAA